MGSVNPIFFLPEAVKKGGDTLAVQFAQSVTLGSGQFCTNPGICILMNNEESIRFIQKTAEALAASVIHPLLTKGISEAFVAGLEKQKKLPGIEVIAKRRERNFDPSIQQVSASHILQHTGYFEEVFGPSTLAVLADNFDEISLIVEKMPGQLTGSIHAEEKDYPQAIELIDQLTQKIGRLLLNGFPTGVEVSAAMVHGGPYPATTDSRVTSVGTTSIYRFTRPVCFQNFPPSLELNIHNLR